MFYWDSVKHCGRQRWNGDRAYHTRSHLLDAFRPLDTHLRWFDRCSLVRSERGRHNGRYSSAPDRSGPRFAFRGGSLFFSPGRYIVTSTLDAGASQGFATWEAPRPHAAATFRRMGASCSGPPHWCGWAVRPTSDVLFKWGGSHCIFDGIGFQGGWDSAPNPPGIGFLMYKTPGLEPGRPAFREFRFHTLRWDFSVPSTEVTITVTPGLSAAFISRTAASVFGSKTIRAWPTASATPSSTTPMCASTSRPVARWSSALARRQNDRLAEY